ncbi:family 47 glycoside hydrolase [Sarocladium strictum]
MLWRSRRMLLLLAAATLSALYFWTLQSDAGPHGQLNTPVTPPSPPFTVNENYAWRTIAINYPPQSIKPLPTEAPKTFPKVQADFSPETDGAKKLRQERQVTVKKTFLKSWKAYKEHAWLQDELKPVKGGSRNPFGGWAASLVDALDTLWIMDLKDEFAEAVDAIDKIDFRETTLSEVNVFETTIRYLGGFLSAFDLSQDVRLLTKAVEVGDMVYKAFDTPNRMPIMRWNIKGAADGERQVAGAGTLSAEIGSLCMELTRLSLVTRDPRWFDAAHRITETFASQQDSTELPGLWPLVVDAENMVFKSGSTFTLGAMADSLYEYLPKMTALTGGQLPVYQRMYEKAMDVAPKYLFYKPMTPTNEDILVSTAFNTKDGSTARGHRDTQGQHLVCFLGGMLAIGGKLFERPHDLQLAEKLTNGCIYAYQAFPNRIMSETWNMVSCDPDSSCPWDEERWKKEVLKANSKGAEATLQEADAIIHDDALPQGFTRIPDRRYILRPEAIESVFVLYRTTGRQSFADTAWDMFTAIEASTRTDLANSAVSDITRPGENPLRTDSMESFWMGETLKYAYLTFSEPDLVSLDDFVFNTEAHPFRRLKA